jgi:hypothetical protein
VYIFIFTWILCIVYCICFILYTIVKVWILFEMWLLQLLLSNSMNYWFKSLVFSALHKRINSEVRKMQLILY